MLINEVTQKRVENLVDGAVARGAIGYLSAWAVRVVVPGIINPMNAVVYSVAGFALQKLLAPAFHQQIADKIDRNSARIAEYAVCSIAAFGVCHFMGNPISIAAALALAGVSLVWNQVFSSKLA